MSNLLKFNMVVCDENKKIIDYNDIIAEKLSELNKKQEELENSGDGFVAGLAFKEIEVMEEEPALPSPEEQLEIARQEADSILEEAKMQAEMIKKQAFEEGNHKGYEEAKAKATAELNSQKAQLQKQEQELRQHYQKLEKEMESTLVPTLMDVFEKVFQIQFADKQDMIMHLLNVALGNINNSNDFIIRVSKEDYPFLKENKEILEERITNASSIEIVEDITLTKRECLIETDGGVFDCSLDVQMENLKKAILTLSMNES